MKLSVFVLAGILLAIVAPEAEAASYTAPALSLVTEVSVVNEEIDQNSKTCGIDADLLQEAIRYPLVKSPLRVVARSEVILDVGLVSGVYNNFCATTYSIELAAFTPVKMHDKYFYGDVILWKSGGLITSFIGNHANRLREAIEDNVKELLVDWNDAKAGMYRPPFRPEEIPR